MNIPLQMPVASLRNDERATWETVLDAYAGMAKLSLIVDDELVRLVNTLARMGDAAVQADLIEPSIVTVLNKAAPIYRIHLWPDHQQQAEEWIAAHCSDIQRFDLSVKKAIAKAFGVTPPHEPILVDLARETGPTLAYTTAGPAGTAGHTVVAPQKNTGADIALDTIFHEISHTMDSRIRGVIDKEAIRQGVKPPQDLWHAVTL